MVENIHFLPSPPFPSLSYLSLPFPHPPLEVGPLNPARRSGEGYKLPQGECLVFVLLNVCAEFDENQTCTIGEITTSVLANQRTNDHTRSQYLQAQVGISVGTQSTLGRQDICARKYMYEKLTKCPNFTRYLHKNIIPIDRLFFFLGGGVFSILHLGLWR